MIWISIVSVPDQCLFIYFSEQTRENSSEVNETDDVDALDSQLLCSTDEKEMRLSVKVMVVCQILPRPTEPYYGYNKNADTLYEMLPKYVKSVISNYTNVSSFGTPLWTLETWWR